MKMVSLLGLLWSTPASAISGPWVVGEQQLNTYVGVDAQRLERLQIRGEGGEGADVIDVGEGISTLGFKGIVTLGLANRFDVELTVPWYRVTANRVDAEICAALGDNSCRPTTSVGVIRARGKALFLDQIAGAPFSLAVSLEGRLGIFTHPTRFRLTNVGEGTQDLGAIVSIGRDGGLFSSGYFSVYTDLGFRYRFPNTRTYPNFEGDITAPGEEYFADAEIVVSPQFRFGFGPTVSGFIRPRGVDFLDADLTDVDRLAALRVGALRVGGTLVVRGDRGVSGSLQVVHTVAAFNNPFVTVVTAGVSFQMGLSKN
jgi:hypothetical protein